MSVAKATKSLGKCLERSCHQSKKWLAQTPVRNHYHCFMAWSNYVFHWFISSKTLVYSMNPQLSIHFLSSLYC